MRHRAARTKYKMYLGKTRISRKHVRKTEDGLHTINRHTDQYIFRCDGCGIQFTRTSKHIKKRQLDPGVLHACPSCQGPGFAAKASKLRKMTLMQDASSTMDISKLR